MRYIAPQQVNGKYWVACERLSFPGSMVGGRMGDYLGHAFRYCYPDMPSALIAMAEWLERSCEGEPVGWQKRRTLPARIEPAG
ncbi:MULTISPECIES: hypothetical protein [unclassified Haematobacter]|uniref:hypothetical protein n=1 Tax=unclassified Haematobacter TaxID=2640585 RepID=UPI0025BF8EBB|nr:MULTISPECIES: hypothetical protein [unclassified Haematobacter]